MHYVYCYDIIAMMMTVYRDCGTTMNVYRDGTTRAVAFVVFSRDARAIDRVQPYYTAPADTAAAALVLAT